MATGSLAAAVEWIERLLGQGPEDSAWRRLEVVVGGDANLECCDNAIQTFKYNAFTFVPRSLFEQFRRTANQYFLVISILMVLGTYTDVFYSPLTPFSTILPLTVILAITMAKEGVEDLKRHKSDEVVNARLSAAVRRGAGPAVVEDVRWKDLRVGRIVIVRGGQEMPADLVLLVSSEGGQAYVETSNIDGETNLKIKRPAQKEAESEGEPMKRPAASKWSSVTELGAAAFALEYEPPCGKVHTFNGTLSVENGKVVALDASSLLLRGSTLRNTRWVAGVVVYTGKDTRLVRNSREAPSKLSEMERVVNKMVLFIMAAMATITTASTLASIGFDSRNKQDLWYLCFRYNHGGAPQLFDANCDDGEKYGSASKWLTFFILYNNFIPISLYVTIEVINSVQAWYVASDRGMYDAESDTPAAARTSNMNADLGMIGYIFSDKTGTLTQNVMTFKRCSVGGVVYGEESENGKHALNALRELLAAPVSGGWLSGASKCVERDFVAVMAVCQNVVPERIEGALEYQAESPDEEALVSGARLLGVEFTQRTAAAVELEWSTAEGVETRSFEVLATIPFDSTRKRMSVVVRCPDGSIRLMTKGADSIVFGLAAAQGFSRIPGGRAALDSDLDSFASDGLRTLVLAQRALSNAHYKKFAQQWHSASTALGERAHLLAQAAGTIERELEVLGATAIEDKLQDGVPETISELRRAGIKLWVLTGDKMETAINIGYAARLLTPDMYVIKMPAAGALKGESGDYGVSAQFDALEAMLSSAAQTSLATSLESQSSVSALQPSTLHAPLRGARDPDEGAVGATASEHLALVIEGSTAVEVILNDEQLSARLFRLCESCKAVIACRVSPAQKRLLVALTHSQATHRPVTLAIGDGANDVGMIQEAHVGVGISGKEGRQAVNNSDFAIAQFRFLKPLLLEHGRRNYRRNAKVIVYSFFKNIVLTLVLFYFQSDNGWSGQSLYEPWVYSGYNFFLGLLPLAMGLFDVDVASATVNRYPALYAAGLHRMDLNVTRTAYATLEAVAASLVVYFVTRAAFQQPVGIWSWNGEVSDVWVFGTCVFVGLVLAMTARACMLIDSWIWSVTPALVLAQLFMLFTFIIFMAQASVKIDYDYFGSAYHAYRLGAFWIVALILVPCAVALLHLVIQALRLECAPTISDVGRELDHGHVDGRRDAALAALLPRRDVSAMSYFASLLAPPSRARPTLVTRDSLQSAHRALTREDSMKLGVSTNVSSSYAYDAASESLGAGAGHDDEENPPRGSLPRNPSFRESLRRPPRDAVLRRPADTSDV